jgi:UrcA family protein
MKTRTLALAAVSAAMLSASAVPAMAADEQKGSASLNYADLDLSTSAGRVELAQRFDQAARQMCGATDASRKLRSNEKYCYDSTSRQLQARVAQILAEHDKKSGLALR